MTTSPLFGEFSGEAQCSSLSMLAFTAGLVGFYCLVNWHLLDAVLASFAAYRLGKVGCGCALTSSRSTRTAASS